VADRVEALPFGEQARRVELCVEDALLVVERAGEIRAVGREDGAAAAADRSRALDLGREWKVVWIRAGATTYARLSRAMWTSVCCQASPSSAVEAT
jgi:hypothetical protein